tara:strand:- start:290 stop:1027 length:738 start_codon:yes stop_codon:yes gene_type:complete
MIIKIDHLSLSSENFHRDIDILKNFGYSVLHQNELLENLENKKSFLNNFHPTQKFCLLTLDNQISIEILEYEKKIYTDSYIIPHIIIPKFLKSTLENNFNFNIHDSGKKSLNGLNMFQIDIHTDNIEKSENFWSSFGFQKEIQLKSEILLMNFNSPFSNETMRIRLIQNSTQNHHKYLDQIGFNCLAFISTSIKNEKSNLESKNILTSKIQPLQIGNTLFDIFFCKSETGEIVEIIEPVKTIHDF